MIRCKDVNTEVASQDSLRMGLSKSFSNVPLGRLHLQTYFTSFDVLLLPNSFVELHDTNPFPLGTLSVSPPRPCVESAQYEVSPSATRLLELPIPLSLYFPCHSHPVYRLTSTPPRF